MTVKRNLFLWRYLFWASGEHSENEPVCFDFNNGISNTGFCSSLLRSFFFFELKDKRNCFLPSSCTITSTRHVCHNSLALASIILCCQQFVIPVIMESVIFKVVSLPPHRMKC